MYHIQILLRLAKLFKKDLKIVSVWKKVSLTAAAAWATAKSVAKQVSSEEDLTWSKWLTSFQR